MEISSVHETLKQNAKIQKLRLDLILVREKDIKRTQKEKLKPLIESHILRSHNFEEGELKDLLPKFYKLGDPRIDAVSPDRQLDFVIFAVSRPEHLPTVVKLPKDMWRWFEERRQEGNEFCSIYNDCPVVYHPELIRTLRLPSLYRDPPRVETSGIADELLNEIEDLEDQMTELKSRLDSISSKLRLYIKPKE